MGSTIASRHGRAEKSYDQEPYSARSRGGGSLDLLDRVPLRDGEEVVVSISEPIPARDLDSLRRAAGVWKGMVDADALIANIYTNRLDTTRLSPVT